MDVLQKTKQNKTKQNKNKQTNKKQKNQKQKQTQSKQTNKQTNKNQLNKRKQTFHKMIRYAVYTFLMFWWCSSVTDVRWGPQVTEINLSPKVFTKTQDFILLSLKVDHFDAHQPFAQIQLHWWNHAISQVVNINRIGFGEWVPIWDYLLSFSIDPILCNQCNCKWTDDFCISAAKKKKKKAPQMTSLWCKNRALLLLVHTGTCPCIS